MNPEQEDFKQLRRLLALKRHEQPPPGYFEDFSRQVISSIKAGHHLEPESLSERIMYEAPWLQRLLGAFEAKPMLAGAFGVAVCGLLISGVVYSEKGASGNSTAALPVPSDQILADAGAPAFNPPGFGGAPVMSVSSTGGVSTFQTSGSLFDEFRQARPQFISFGVPNGRSDN